MTLLPALRRLLPALLLLAAPAAAQQVTLERDSPLYSEPNLQSSRVVELKSGATGEVVGKQGGWLNLRTAEGAGWLFSFNVRFPAQAAGGDGGAGTALGRVFGPQRSGTVVSAIGIRGLEEEDLKQARFSAGQMKLLDGYAVTKQAAEDRAREAGLKPATVDYMDAKQ